MRYNLNPSGDIELDRNGNPISEWVVNIGGSWTNNFSSGIVVPIYVIILGFVGGYLRYLYKSSSKEERRREVGDEYYNTHTFMHVPFGELSRIFLSALLAAIVWIMLTQGTTTNNLYFLAAVSFSVGLATMEIIKGVVSFVGPFSGIRE